MKVIIRSATFVDGKLLEPGKKPVEVDGAVGRQLIASQKAIAAPAKSESGDK